MCILHTYVEKKFGKSCVKVKHASSIKDVSVNFECTGHDVCTFSSLDADFVFWDQQGTDIPFEIYY